MDTRKLSSFIIAVGLILIVLGGGNWVKVENNAKQANEFREAMRSAEIERAGKLSGAEKRRAMLGILDNIGSELDMITKHGYIRTARKDHTISYFLMIGGILVIIIGVGIRVSSSKEIKTERVDGK